jgi:hypothetical protein
MDSIFFLIGFLLLVIDSLVLIRLRLLIRRYARAPLDGYPLR